MSDIAIRVENLTKKFFLGERVGIKTFREALQDLVTAPFRVWKKNGQGDGQEKIDTEREIWALKGVSFEVKHGEVLGIIGPNGAGKSTLLKILSRITEPTGGYAEIRGRVGSLLEVGTGFHPELTGRENVYLNGAILGMSKAEIRRKFDDIVSFAGVEKFIDTPVKRYSSGMQVRLAFAVAAHLDPEILIIDEVLAVGDAEFQKRCLGKMNEVARSGRTVLFVSHNMAAVEALCTRAILLRTGRVVACGIPSSVIVTHLDQRSTRSAQWYADGCESVKYGDPSVLYIQLLDQTGHPRSTFAIGDDIVVSAKLGGIPQRAHVELSIRIYDRHNRRVLTCNNRFQHPAPLKVEGTGVITCRIVKCRLSPGEYELSVVVYVNAVQLRIPPRLQFVILPRDLYRTGLVLPAHTTVWAPEVEWCVNDL